MHKWREFYKISYTFLIYLLLMLYTDILTVFRIQPISVYFNNTFLSALENLHNNLFLNITVCISCKLM